MTENDLHYLRYAIMIAVLRPKIASCIACRARKSGTPYPIQGPAFRRQLDFNATIQADEKLQFSRGNSNQVI